MEEAPSQNRVYLKSRPGINASPAESNFGFEICDDPILKDDSVIAKTLYLSVDPYMRCMMNEESGVDYVQAWAIGATLSGPGVGIVVKSNSENYEEGDIVMSIGMEWPWQALVCLPIGQIRKIKQGIPPSLFLGMFGISGLTGAIGIMERANIDSSSNQTLVISGAAGACGSIAGQVAKLLRCKNVVGICGTQEKCNYLTKELGLDAAISYKTENVDQKLKTLCPNGVDVYFDNVGGNISDAVISQMNKNSCIILCGQISKYNTDEPYPPPLSSQTAALVSQNMISRERFLVLNYQSKFNLTIQFLVNAFKQNKIKNRETIVNGLSNAGHAFVSMMNGGNIGKQIVQL